MWMKPSVTEEFAGAEFGDERLGKRLMKIAARVGKAPSASLPGAMKTTSELEGTYRFLRHPEVSPERILAPHVEQTCVRANEAGRVVVAHDTSHFCFTTPREGLGRGSNGEDRRVFFGHVALAVTADGGRQALGVLAAKHHVRTGSPQRKKSRHSEKKPESDRESSRWWNTVAQAEEQLQGRAETIHVMDREADQYVLAARMVDANYRFVIRNKHNRQIVVEGNRDATLRTALAPLEGSFCRQVELTAKDPKPLAKKRGHKRQTRQATLEFRATQVVLRKPSSTPKTSFELPDALTLNIIHVVEREPPEGYAAIDWKLLTTEPIATVEDIQFAVDAYRARWVIEEFFKALKTGCAFTKRQLETATTILNAFAIFLPIAWSLLRLRSLAQDSADTPAHNVLNALQVRLLQRHPDVRLNEQPTVLQACLAIARLGGHIRQNGPPGWQVLGRGYEELLRLELGAKLAQSAPTYDLS